MYLEVSLLLKYYKFLLLGLFLLVSGCFQLTPCGKLQLTYCKSKINPNSLPNAIVGHPYFVKIEILGGTIIHEDDIKWELLSNQTWLNVKLFKDNEMHYNGTSIYRGIEITGIPKSQEDTTIRVYGQSSRPCICTFDKTFTLKVNP